jgi:hypothetical protein
MSDDKKPMTDGERRSFLEQWQQDNLVSMTPSERYLYNNGLFDDVIRPKITAEDVVLEQTFASISAMRNVSDIGSEMGRFDIAPMNAIRTPG